ADGNAAGAKCGCKSARPVIFSLRPALSMPTTRGSLRRKLGPITFAARHERKEGRLGNDRQHPAGIFLRGPRDRHGGELRQDRDRRRHRLVRRGDGRQEPGASRRRLRGTYDLQGADRPRHADGGLHLRGVRHGAARPRRHLRLPDAQLPRSGEGGRPRRCQGARYGALSSEAARTLRQHLLGGWPARARGRGRAHGAGAAGDQGGLRAAGFASRAGEGRACQPWFDKLTTGLEQIDHIPTLRPRLVEGRAAHTKPWFDRLTTRSGILSHRPEPVEGRAAIVRIVGGQLRGRPLAPPADDRTRPTSDRVREAVFNILAHGIPGSTLGGARVLDLFAGTGALGLEALSRGAGFCLFVEEDAQARALIRRNVEAFGLTGVTKIFRRDATDLGPAGRNGGYTLVFLDPPYGRGLAERALASAAAGGW